MQTGIPLKMVGEDGNAFLILGRASKALRRAKKPELIKEFQNEATAGDYNHLLKTCMEWFEVDVQTGENDYDENY